mgnify:CR=1 FL=1
MRVVVITPPAPVVTWEEADQHLRLDGDDEQRDGGRRGDARVLEDPKDAVPEEQRHVRLG